VRTRAFRVAGVSGKTRETVKPLPAQTLRGLLRMYETAIAELRAMHDPTVDERLAVVGRHLIETHRAEVVVHVPRQRGAVVAEDAISVERGWDTVRGPIPPKSKAGVRKVPVPAILGELLRSHVERTSRSGDDLLFAREPPGRGRARAAIASTSTTATSTTARARRAAAAAKASGRSARSATTNADTPTRRTSTRAGSQRRAPTATWGTRTRPCKRDTDTHSTASLPRTRRG
jgi:hypothetical protein